MKRQILSMLAAAAVLASTSTLLVSGPSSASGGPITTLASTTQVVRGCDVPLAHHARCQIEHLRRARRTSQPATTVGGLAPATVIGAYGWPKTGGTGETIAIVDAGGLPGIATYLATFDTHFLLPACTIASGCFTVLNQTGATSPLPTPTVTWGLEISLDVEWAHAIAPKARLILVESTTANTVTMFKAVTTAAQRASYVSMSWGLTTYFAGASATSYIPHATEVTYDKVFAKHPTVSFFAATGDTAAEVIYPATSPSVVAVGGTTLSVTKTNHSLTSEKAWRQAGGGCSPYEKANAAQKSFAGYATAIARSTATATVQGWHCLPFATSPRATPDVSADANPSTGVAVYGKTSSFVGWIQVGGTSLATPLTAARAADSTSAFNASVIYNGRLNLRDITTGSNTHACVTGYDLCSGRGVWSGYALTASAAASTVVAGTALSFSLRATSPAPTGGLSVSLRASDATGKFSTSLTGTYTSTLTTSIPKGSTSLTVYFKDTKVGTPLISISMGSTLITSFTEKVKVGTVSKVVITPSSAQTITGGSKKTFSVASADAYTNVVSTSITVTWSTTVSGASLSVSKGSRTTFSAPSSAASGVIKATFGVLSASVAISVTATSATTSVTLTGATTTKSGTEYSKVLTASYLSGSMPIAGASLSFSVYSSSCAGTRVATGSATTASTGRGSFTFSTHSEGRYCAKVAASKSSYQTASTTLTFTIVSTAGLLRRSLFAPVSLPVARP